MQSSINWKEGDHSCNHSSDLTSSQQSADPGGISMGPSRVNMPHYACFFGRMVHGGQIFWKSTQLDATKWSKDQQACWRPPPIVMHAVIASGQTQEGTWSPMAKGSEEGCGFCRAVWGDAWVWQDCRDAYFELRRVAWPCLNWYKLGGSLVTLKGYTLTVVLVVNSMLVMGNL